MTTPAEHPAASTNARGAGSGASPECASNSVSKAAHTEADGVAVPLSDGCHPAPSAASVDPMQPSATLLIKLGSALVHAVELIEDGGHVYDLEAMRQLCADPEVVAWLKAMGALALLPVKRSA